MEAKEIVLEEWDFYLDFHEGVLTYHYDRGKVVYIGGYTPEFHIFGERVLGHNTPDYPIDLFADELEGNENFLNDPIHCTLGGVVLLGSGREVLLHTLSKQEQDNALRQMERVSFQQTVPFEIKKRLQTICSDRWKLYELFAYVPSSMMLFDHNPSLARMLASADVWRKERGKELRDKISALLDALKHEVELDEKIMGWLSS